MECASPFVSSFTLQDILCVTPRGLADHVDWLVETGNIAEAAAVAHANAATLEPARVSSLYNQFIDGLLRKGRADQVSSARRDCKRSYPCSYRAPLLAVCAGPAGVPGAARA